MAGEIPANPYLLDKLLAGNFIELGAVKAIAVPLGLTVNCHFISKAHSIVLPATTEPSFAVIFTAVHASLKKGANTKVSESDEAIIL